LNEELLEDPIPPEDIDEVLETRDTSIGADELLTEEASSATATTEEDEESFPEDVELDLSPGELDKTSDPIRVYMREMGLVPLLKREQRWRSPNGSSGDTSGPERDFAFSHCGC